MCRTKGSSGPGLGTGVVHLLYNTGHVSGLRLLTGTHLSIEEKVEKQSANPK